MLEFFHRKRKAIFYGAAATAVAAGIYSWYTWGDNEQAQEQAREEAKRASHAALLELVKESTPSVEEAEDAIGILGSPHPHTNQKHPSRARGSNSNSNVPLSEEQLALDASMDSHFTYIQEVSAPQELDQLLPNLHATLAKLTDIKLLKQLQQQQQQQGASSDADAAAPTAAAAAEQQLRALARLCFCRALGAIWLIPCMDLLVRLKLNLIGRHLFLQEKLGKLRAAVALSMRATPAGLGQGLPPQLSPRAIEVFLQCDWLAGSGCAWVLDRVAEGVDAVLSTLSLDAEVSPQELLQIMAAMLRETEAAMTRCPWGQAGTWEPLPGALGSTRSVGGVGSVGTGGTAAAEARRRPAAGAGLQGVGNGPAAMAESLSAEWRACEEARRASGAGVGAGGVLLAGVGAGGSGSDFGALAGGSASALCVQSAAQAGAHLGLGQFPQKRASLGDRSVSCSLPCVDEGSASVNAVAGGDAGARSAPGAGSAAAATAAGGMQGRRSYNGGGRLGAGAGAAGAAGGVVPPWAAMLAGPSGVGAIDTQAAWRQGPDVYQQSLASAAMVEELHAELCGILSTSRFNEAMRTAVQHTFRAAASHVYASFPAGPAAPGTGAASAAASSEVTQVDADAGTLPDRPGSPTRPAPGPSSSYPPAAASAAVPSPGRGSAALRHSPSAVFGAVPSNTFFLSNTGLIAGKAARPVARLLRTVQASGDTTFEQIKGVTKGIATLPSVMALSATAFASTAQLQL